MKEPVDKLLTGRIRQVFEDFEDPSADAGWKALRKKYPDRNRRPLILWLSSAAAVLLVAAGLWFMRPPEQLIVLKPAQKAKPVQKGEDLKAPGRASIGDIEVGQKPVSSRPAAEERLDRDIVVAGNQKLPGTSANENNSAPLTMEEGMQPVSEIIFDKGTVKGSLIERPAEQAYATTSKRILPEISTPDNKNGNPAIVKLPVVKRPESIREAQLVKDEKLLDATTPSIKKPVIATVSIDQVEKSVVAKEFSPRPVKEIIKDAPAKSKRQKQGFTVYAGSYFNYSEGSENQLNFGAGIMSDIRLSRNLKVSTGVSIASNSLNYSGGRNLPENAAASFQSTASYTPGNLTTITSYHADLLALDIPVNLKYQFVPESDRFYVSAGLSSGTYLNETYAYQYRNFNTASGSYISQTEDQKIKKQLNDFDIGRTLNLSLGLSTRFGKTQTISIEPFLKYPLGGLGSENLKFGSTGINLKLRFNP